MIRIASGVTDQVVYFSAPPFLSSFTVYRARNGATPAVMTTPTVVEEDQANMPGTYSLLLDEDMTIGGGNATEAMRFHILEGVFTTTIDVELFDASSSGLTTQNVRDAMKLTPTGGAPSADSIDEHLDNIPITAMRGTDGANTTAPDNAGIAAVQAKTDQLVFTKANEVDANAKSINNATVVGDGNATPWDGA